VRIVRRAGLYALVAGVALISYGTISNQVRLGAVNARFRAQAIAGQRALDRQCRLLPVSLKLYGYALEQHVITAEEYRQIVATGARYCPGR
jgi:hypothetical protein